MSIILLNICNISVNFFIISPHSFRAENNPDHLGAQQQENHIDPFKGTTCHSQGIEPGWGG